MKNVRRPCQGLSLEGDGPSSGISLLHVIVMGVLQDAFFFLRARLCPALRSPRGLRFFYFKISQKSSLSTS
jgi:hypothetical protein